MAYLPTALSKTMKIVLDTETTGLKPELGNRSRSGSSAVSSAFIVKPGVNFSGASGPKPSGDAS